MDLEHTAISGRHPLSEPADRWKISHDTEKPARPAALVVDDEMLIRWAVSELLRELGFDVQQASDARSALEAITDPAAFELVMLDVRLPDCHDLGLLQQVRALLPAARIIVMTAHGTRELFEEALALGAYSVVSKPFELSNVADTIARGRPPSG